MLKYGMFKKLIIGMVGSLLAGACFASTTIPGVTTTQGLVVTGRATIESITATNLIRAGGVSTTGTVTAGAFSGNGAGITGVTASYATVAGTATTAAYATQAGSSSYSAVAGIATSAATASSADFSTISGTATNAGYAIAAGSAGYATVSGQSTTSAYSSLSGQATTSVTASYAAIAGTATTAAYSTLSGTATSAGYAVAAGSADYAAVSANATNAAYAINSGTATSAATATYAANSGQATSAAYAVNSGTATAAASATTLSVTLSPQRGGTGLTTFEVGDIIYASSVSALSRLPIGSSGKVLVSRGGIPSYEAASAGGITSITASNGLTGGGSSSSVTLEVAYGGTGTATTAARSNHNHSVLSNGTGIVALSYSATQTATVSLDVSGVTAGTYYAPTITVDAYGRMTACSSTTVTSYTPDVTGWSGSPTKACYYKLIGKTCIVWFNVSGSGNAGGVSAVSMTLPFAPAVSDTITMGAYIFDNGAVKNSGRIGNINAGNTTINIYQPLDAAWSSGTGGRQIAGQFIFERQ